MGEACFLPLTCKFIEETRPRHSKNKIEIQIYVNICEPGIVLSTSCVITHSILTTFYRSRCHYCSHFTGEETEKPRFRGVCGQVYIPGAGGDRIQTQQVWLWPWWLRRASGSVSPTSGVGAQVQ